MDAAVVAGIVREHRSQTPSSAFDKSISPSVYPNERKGTCLPQTCFCRAPMRPVGRRHRAPRPTRDSSATLIRVVSSRIIPNLLKAGSSAFYLSDPATLLGDLDRANRP